MIPKFRLLPLSGKRAMAQMGCGLSLLAVLSLPATLTAQFALQPVGSSSAAQSITVTVQTGGTVSQVRVLSNGIANAAKPEFAASGSSTCAAGPVSKGDTCQESVVFTPTAPGVRIGAIELLDASGNALATQQLYGLGRDGLGVLWPGNVPTVAGQVKKADFGGDGGPATQAFMKLPSAVVLDGAGNMYIADSGNNRVRRVDAATGIISTLAGQGNPGFSGDGGAATSAKLDTPFGLALDGAGNLYIADSGNNRIRVVPHATTVAAPIIRTMAGTGADGSAGDGGAALKAELNKPLGLAISPEGNLYIADTSNQKIRMVDLVTGVITTVAGNGAASGRNDGQGTYSGDGGLATDAGLNLPYAVAFDPSGNWFIADYQNSVIRKVDTAGIITTYAGNGTAGYSGDGYQATTGELNLPAGIATDPAGNLFIADSFNAAIRKVNASTGIIKTLILDHWQETMAPDGTISPILLYGPVGLYVDGGGNLFLANYYYMCIDEIEASSGFLDFTYPYTQVQDTSSPWQMGIENDGNYPLDLTSIKLGPNTVRDAATSTCTLDTPMDSGGFCELGLSFAPKLSLVFPTGATSMKVIDPNDVYGNTDGDAADVEDFPLSIDVVGIATPINATVVTVTSSQNPATYKQPVTFTIRVTSGKGQGTPTGSITLTDTLNGKTTTLAPGLVLFSDTDPAHPNTGKATFTPGTPLAVGLHTITANYVPTGKFLQNSGTMTETVGETTATTITSNKNPALPLTAVTFTATVAASGGGNLIPDGTVNWTIDKVQVKSATLSAAGVSTYTTSTLAQGPHTVSVTYTGDSTLGIMGSTGTLVQEMETDSTTVLTASSATSHYGALVTFTAQVTGNGTVVPTGKVNFVDTFNGVQTTLGTGVLDATGKTTLPYTGLAVGAHSIVANYLGDVDYLTSSSSAVPHTVSRAATSTVVSATDPGLAGVPETITATVTITDGSAKITGTVAFTDQTTGTSLGTATVSTAGIATVSAIFKQGTHSIVAVYSGDTNLDTSTSPAFPLTIDLAATTVTLSALPTGGQVLGGQVIFTANVSGKGALPTGAITFQDTFGGVTKTLGTGTLDAKGNATFTLSTLAVGTHSIVAKYTGDANNQSGSSDPLSYLVGKLDTATSLMEATSTGATPQSFLIATVVDKTQGSVPSGTVTFLNISNNTTIGQITLDKNGVANITPNLPTGTYQVEAQYSGDTTHNASTSPVVSFNTTSAAFSMTVSEPKITLVDGQNTTLSVTIASTGGFADSIGLGCGSLPSGVNCHFVANPLKLAANGSVATDLTIDTSNPLGGGGSTMNRTARPGGLTLAGVFAPFGLLFGLLLWRFRRRHARAFTLALLLVTGIAAMAISGCSGFSQKYATPGTYTLQVVGVGNNTDTTHYATIQLTITAK